MLRHLKLISIILVVFLIIATGCKDKSAATTAPEAPAVTNDSGGNIGTSDGSTSTDGSGLSGSGVSSTPGITVEEGRIKVDLEDGKINIGGENVTLTVKEGEEFKLVDGITIIVKDEDGNTIPGEIYVDPETGKIYFIPSVALDAGKTYTITVTINGKEYKATVVVAVDNTCESNSMFAPVEIKAKGTYSIPSLIVGGKSIFGWEFGSATPQFYMKFIDLEQGAKIYFTAFGTYDIENHRCEVYYQRWTSTGKPVKDEEWIYSSIRVNADDSSIDGENGDPDYSFKKTYLMLRVVNADGADITASTNAKLVIY